MNIVPMKALLDAAFRKYAVPAINVSSYEHVRCILDVAKEMRSPVILQSAPVEHRHCSAKVISAMIRAVSEDLDVPVAIHLDHGDGMVSAMTSIAAGFTSVMFDGSTLGYEENERISRQVADAARAAGASVEVELGAVGLASEAAADGEADHMTSPELAKQFVEATRPDALAVSIGNAHGLYPFPPKLDFQRLAAIDRQVDMPLVLHGGTGIPPEAIAQAIPLGIAKINFSTAMRVAFIRGMYDFVTEHPEETYTFNIFKPAMAAFREAVREAIRYCGSEGKA